MTTVDMLRIQRYFYSLYGNKWKIIIYAEKTEEKLKYQHLEFLKPSTTSFE